MKKEYNTPRAEKLNFDYTKVVIASDGSTVNGDKGWQAGCKDGPHPSDKTFQKKKCV